MKFSKILEAKQVGILYHYTSLDNAINILKQNVLQTGEELSYISFTRNKNFHKVKREGIITDMKFIINGDKLSEKYKIQPFNYFSHFQRDKLKEPLVYDEDEELIDFFGTKFPYYIQNFKNYIISIIIYTNKINKKFIKNNLEQLKKICKEKNIKFIEE